MTPGERASQAIRAWTHPTTVLPPLGGVTALRRQFGARRGMPRFLVKKPFAIETLGIAINATV